DTGLGSTSLRTLTERLRELAQGTQSLVLGGLPAEAAHRPPSLTLLARVVDLVGAAKGLFSWLNRYLFSTLNDFSASRDIILLCTQLAETLQADCPTAERDGQILRICQHIVGICESIVGCSPPALLDRRAVLQRVGLALPPSLQGSPPVPGHPTPTLPLPQALAAHGGRILPGDEIVQVNEQVVVGWTRVNLAKKLLEKASRVTLVLKKIPLDLPSSPHSPRQQVSHPSAPSIAPVLHWAVLGTRQGCSELGISHHVGGPESSVGPCKCGAGRSPIAGPPWRSRGFASQGSLFPPSAAADLDSGPDSVPDLITDEEEGQDERDLSLPRAAMGELPGLPGHGRRGTEGTSGDGAVSPLGREAAAPLAVYRCCGGGGVGGWHPTGHPLLPGHPCCHRTLCHGAQPHGSPPRRGWGHRAQPAPWGGVATRLSRRRISCRDLGRVDCDGWLLKKKDHVGFMAQKWKRCWFVLKGHTLYWYHHPNDEKAAGLINVATYDLESTREQKKKYVFQLSHQRYKPFVFAAETLADLSMWVSHLITAKTKYTLAHQSVPDREEDCYSETEAEDPDDESPRHGCDLVSGPRGHPGEGTEDPCLTSCLVSPSSQRRGCKTPQRKPSSSQPAASPAAQPAAPRAAPGPAHPWVEQGHVRGQPHGVPGLPPCYSPLSPHPDPTGEDLECLMRCLKQGGVSLIGRQRFLTQEQCRKSFIRRAKLVELRALEQLLSDAALTSEKFTRWKEEHQELYQELREWWARQQGQDGDGGLGGEHGPPKKAAEP
ncbi:CNKR1 kinase, partial [Sagittarius serpentarius]|nr:CNKR1 kinase [Sagittarius serpentarius]